MIEFDYEGQTAARFGLPACAPPRLARRHVMRERWSGWCARGLLCLAVAAG